MPLHSKIKCTMDFSDYSESQTVSWNKTEDLVAREVTKTEQTRNQGRRIYNELPEDLQFIVDKMIWKLKWDDVLHSIIFRNRMCVECDDFIDRYIHTGEEITGGKLGMGDTVHYRKNVWVIPLRFLYPTLPSGWTVVCYNCQDS